MPQIESELRMKALVNIVGVMYWYCSGIDRARSRAGVAMPR